MLYKKDSVSIMSILFNQLRKEKKKEDNSNYPYLKDWEGVPNRCRDKCKLLAEKYLKNTDTYRGKKYYTSSDLAHQFEADWENRYEYFFRVGLASYSWQGYTKQFKELYELVDKMNNKELFNHFFK